MTDIYIYIYIYIYMKEMWEDMNRLRYDTILGDAEWEIEKEKGINNANSLKKIVLFGVCSEKRIH